MNELEEQRDFLLASLDDLDREHAAGDLDAADHAALRDDYTARAAEVLRALDERRPVAPEVRPSSRRGRTFVVAGAIVAVALLAGVLMARASGRRDGGESVTGEVRRTPTQEAQACLPLAFETARDPGKVVDAQECFKGVLDQDPRNPTALTYLGWALLLSGDTRLVTPGKDFLLRAVASAPDYPDARAFLAIVATRLGDFAEADRQLDRFAELDPGPEIARLTDGLRAEIDAGLARGTSTTASTAPGAPPAPSTSAPTG